MKAIFKYLPLAIMALASVACNKVLEKDEVEAGFTAKEGVPSVTIDPNVVVDEYAGTVTVTATFSGVSADMDSLEIGFLSSTDPSMTLTTDSGRAVLIENPADGTYTCDVTVTAGVTNYIMAMAATTGGAAYSEKLTVEVPDIPWYYKVGTRYAGTVTAEQYGSGTSYEHVVELEFSEDFKTLYITDMDPWAVQNVNYNKGSNNVGVGQVDLDNRTVTFLPDESGYVNIYLSPVAFLFPVAEVTDEGFYSDDKYVITFSEDGSTIDFPMYAVFSPSAGGLVEIYDQFTLTKN